MFQGPVDLPVFYNALIVRVVIGSEKYKTWGRNKLNVKFVINCFFHQSRQVTTAGSTPSWLSLYPLQRPRAPPQGGPHTCRLTSASALYLAGETVVVATGMWYHPAKPESQKVTAPERCRFSEGVAVLGKENVSSQMGYNTILVFCLAYSLLSARDRSQSQGLPTFLWVFLFILVNASFLSLLGAAQLSFKGNVLAGRGKYFLVCYSLTIYIF